jgi:hypothetical protein
MINVHLSSFAYSRMKSCRWITYPQHTCKRLWTLKSVNSVMYLFIHAGYYNPCVQVQVIIYPCRLLYIHLHTYLFMCRLLYIRMCAGAGYYLSMCVYLAIALLSCYYPALLLSMFHVKHFRLFPCIPIYPCRLL